MLWPYGAQRARRAREPRCGRGTGHPIERRHHTARGHVRVAGDLAQREHRGEARVATFEQIAPFAARALRERFLQYLPQPGPRFRIEPVLERLGVEPEL